MPFSPSIIAPPEGWGSQKPSAGTPIDCGHCLARSLEWFLPLSDGSGTLCQDASGRGRPGAFVDGVRWATTSSGIVAATTLSTNYIRGPAINVGSGLSCCARVFQSQRSSGDAGVISKFYLGGKYSWRLTIGPDGRLMAYLSATGGSGYSASSSYFLPLSTWTTLGLAWNASGAAKLYVNGKAVWSSTSAPTSLYASSQPIWLAMNYDLLAAYAFAGYFDFAAVWSRTLGDAEFAQIADRPFHLFSHFDPQAGDGLGRRLVDGSLASHSPILGAAV
ncbi:MAG: LamG-like jellyroll fold domain-containing protein [Thermoguttaceae bacterium]